MERTKSFVDRGNILIAEGDTPEAMKLVARGLQYYSGKVIKSISPYSKADAGLVVIALRHLADEVEKNNPGAKELAEGLGKCIIYPELKEIEKIQKANKK